MISSSSTFCFATLAFGANYQALVRELLAKDLERYAPGVPLLILTNNPSEFKDCTNAIVVEHQQRLYCDNDKVFLIKTALGKFDTCVCIDADMRLIGAFPQDLEFQPGITARSCDQLLHHIQARVDRTEIPRPDQMRYLEQVRKVAQKLELNLESDPVKFVHEFLFVVRRDSGKELQVLELAEMIARYLELHGTLVGVGAALGMAAAKVGFPVRHSEMPGVQFFDDRIEKIRISKGQSAPAASTHYFEHLRKIKNPPRSFFENLILRIGRGIARWQRRNRIKQEAAKNPSFYYQ